VFLIGGGREPEGVRASHAPFLAALEGEAVVFLLEEEGATPERWIGQLDGRARCVIVSRDRPPAPEDLEGAGGVYVAGGWTPGYAEAMAGFQIPAGMPYCGFSAGAAIASSAAIVGGWRLDVRAICPEDAGEDLEAVEPRAGLGLVAFSVDVHAAQWGTLSRLAAAVETGLVDEGYAIDEHTVLTVAPDGARSVAGLGHAWHVRRENGVTAVTPMCA